MALVLPRLRSFSRQEKFVVMLAQVHKTQDRLDLHQLASKKATDEVEGIFTCVCLFQHFSSRWMLDAIVRRRAYPAVRRPILKESKKINTKIWNRNKHYVLAEDVWQCSNRHLDTASTTLMLGHCRCHTAAISTSCSKVGKACKRSVIQPEAGAEVRGGCLRHTRQ